MLSIYGLLTYDGGIIIYLSQRGRTQRVEEFLNDEVRGRPTFSKKCENMEGYIFGLHQDVCSCDLDFSFFKKEFLLCKEKFCLRVN